MNNLKDVAQYTGGTEEHAAMQKLGTIQLKQTDGGQEMKPRFLNCYIFHGYS